MLGYYMPKSYLHNAFEDSDRQDCTTDMRIAGIFDRKFYFLLFYRQHTNLPTTFIPH